MKRRQRNTRRPNKIMRGRGVAKEEEEVALRGAMESEGREGNDRRCIQIDHLSLSQRSLTVEKKVPSVSCFTLNFANKNDLVDSSSIFAKSKAVVTTATISRGPEKTWQ